MKNIQVVISPENASNKDYTVTSLNPEIVSVDEDGNCKAESPGTAKMRVTTADGGFVSEFEITVKAPEVKVEGVAVEAAETELTVGDTVAVGE